MSKFSQDLKQGGERGIKGLGQQMKSVFSPKNLAVAGVAGGVALAGAITAGLAGAAKALVDIERLNAQTDAAIRSTGGVANVTRDGVEELAEGIESLTTIERESVQEGANLLLTFKNIRNEAGEGNDIFDQATEAMVDMSVAMGTDVAGGAIQLGKALNDPIKGIAALSRVGITFTEDQEAMIRGMVEAGDVMGAQKIILQELESQFGGSAEAFANTTAGKIQRFQNDVGNMFESIILGAVTVGEHLGGAADDVGDSVGIIAMHFGDLGDQSNDLADRMGISFDDLKNMVRDRMEETGETVEEALSGIESDWEDAKLSTRESAWEMMQGINEAAVEGTQQLEKQAYRMAAVVPDEIRARWQDTRSAAFQMAVEHAKGILDGQNQVKVAFEVLTQLQEEEQTRAQRISYLKGVLSSSELAAGLNDGRPGVSGAARALRGQIEAELASLGVNAYNSGYSIGKEVARGIYNSAHLADGASSYLAAKVSGYLPRSEPKEGPLRGITKVGHAIVSSITDGIYSNLGAAGNAANALAGALSPSFGTPALAGIPSGGMAAVGPTYIVNVNGVQRTVKSEEEAMQALHDLGAFSGDGRLS